MKENIEELITVSSPNLQEPMVIGRVLGKYGQRRNGPALIVTAGVHGNEPSGIIAFKKVQQSLTQMNLP